MKGTSGGSSMKLVLIGVAALLAYSQFGGMGLILLGVALVLLN